MELGRNLELQKEQQIDACIACIDIGCEDLCQAAILS